MDGSVLITGASSGIGRASALRLAARGFSVFAGVRKDSDGEALRASGGEAIVPVRLDVTERSSIHAAVELVGGRLAGRGLDGLVNNAGIGLTAPIEYVDERSLHRQFDVNVFGLVAVTQAFLPLVRAARGRVVNIGSVGAHLAIPFGGILCATKSAVTSLNDAMRLELRPFGIHVSLVEPAAIATPAVDKTLGDVERTLAALPPEGVHRYGPWLREFTRRAHEREEHGSPPDVVAKAVEHALTAAHPRLRYTVGKGSRVLGSLAQWLPDRLLDPLRLRLFGLPTRFGASARS